ncbi:MAG TPA: flavodoxin domain-containing protein, partial [Gemmatimonadales bacterium]|nr:flavodoxin domain-containing protein [Gemmatimonadales bacterium]
MSRRILILYGTTYGQTALISRRIANQLAALGYSVTLMNGADPDVPSPEGFDGVMIGASLIAGRHQKCVERYIRVYRDALGARPSAFFSVSASASDTQGKGQADAARTLEQFLERLSWSPAL